MRHVLIALALLAAPASAKIVAADSHGFALHQSVEVAVPPARAWAALVRVQDWWSKDHTYSGKAERLSLDPRPGGCFCERLDGGGGGGTITAAPRPTIDLPRRAPARRSRTVLTGGLGPLLLEGTAGVMNITIAKTPGGARITLDYRVAGFGRANGSDLAPGVDQVIAEQLKRLAAAAARPLKR